jgi:outer membrane lipoprotein SlyB
MADRLEDKKEYQGLRGRFRKMNEDEESYLNDMRHEWKKGVGDDASFLIVLVPLMGIVGGMLGGFGGGVAGGGVGLVVDGMVEGSPEADTVIMEQATPDNRYQIVRDGGQVYMLVAQDNNVYVMTQHGSREFQYLEDPANALGAVQNVVEQLDLAITEMENGNLPDQRILTFLKAQDYLSVLHTEGGNIERTFDELEIDSSMRTQYLEKLKGARDFWTGSAQHMVNVDYGLSDADVAALPSDVDLEPYAINGAFLGGILGVSLGLGFIPIDLVRCTNRRRRKRKALRGNQNRM